MRLTISRAMKNFGVSSGLSISAGGIRGLSFDVGELFACEVEGGGECGAGGRKDAGGEVLYRPGGGIFA